MCDVVVVGDADTDIFLEIPHIPTWDEGVVAKRVLKRAGGKGANFAAALSVLGVSTGLLACVGDDEYGQIAKAALEQHLVDTSHVLTIPGQATYYCIMLLDPTGEKALVVVKTPIIYPQPAQIKANSEYLISAKHVHTIGLDPDKVQEALIIARQGGRSTSVDLDSASAGLAKSQALLEHSSIVFVNERGARLLFDNEDLERAGKSLVAL